MEVEDIPQRDHSAERAEMTPMATEPISELVSHYNLRPRSYPQSAHTVCAISGDLRISLLAKRATSVTLASAPSSTAIQAQKYDQPTTTMPTTLGMSSELIELSRTSPLQRSDPQMQCIKCTGFGHQWNKCANLSNFERTLIQREHGEAVRLAIHEHYRVNAKDRRLLSVKKSISLDHLQDANFMSIVGSPPVPGSDPAGGRGRRLALKGRNGPGSGSQRGRGMQRGSGSQRGRGGRGQWGNQGRGMKRGGGCGKECQRGQRREKKALVRCPYCKFRGHEQSECRRFKKDNNWGCNGSS